MSRHQVKVLLKLPILSTFALAIILLAACGPSQGSGSAPPAATVARATATVPPLPAPTSVIVLRLGGFGEYTHVAPFQMTAQDTARVSQLYHAVSVLPLSTRVSCPRDQGVGYELSFLNGNTLVLQVVMDDACQLVKISSTSGPACRQWTPAFTAEIATTLGVSATTLEPPNGLLNTAKPNGPLAQPVPTPPVLTPKSC